MTLEELLARLATASQEVEDQPRLVGLSDEDLAEMEGQLRQTYRDLRAGELNDDVIALLGHIADAIDQLGAEAALRLADVEELQRQASETDARILAQEEEETPAEETPAEEETPEEEAPAEEEAPEAVAASARPAPRPIGELARHVPIRARSREAEHVGARVSATPNVPNMHGGQEIQDRHQLAQAMSDAWNANRGARGEGVKVPVARVETEWPEDRILRTGDSHWTNYEKVRDFLTQFSIQDAILAAGGICAPTTPIYEQIVISQASRPVRDALPGFRADRGGINWITPPSLASIGTSGGSPSQAISQVTNAQDVAGALKPHEFVNCGAAESAQIYAVTKILEFGNLMDRTFPEEVAAYNDLSMAAHSRFAENLVLTTIAAGSTAVTTQQDLGVARDILNFVTLAAVAYRNRHRMDVNAPVRVMLPAWLIGMIQSDVWSALNVGPDEQGVTVNQATITSWFATRNVNVTFFEDGVGPGTPAYQIFPTQAAGALNNWPTVVQWYMFHEGAWLFLDGGTLDLGIVRDSTLDAANKFQTFMETFEQVAFIGIESLMVRSTICMNGATAGTIDPNALCDGGS